MHSSILSTRFGDIFYRWNDAAGPVAVLVHGNSGSSEGFLPLAKEAFGRKYRIFALDLPGHGQSSPARKPEVTYSPFGFAEVLADFASELDLRNALWIGHSLGGHILIDAWGNLPDPAGLAFFGTSPLAVPPDFTAAYPPNPDLALFFSPATEPGDALRAVGAGMPPGLNPDPLTVDDFRRTDPESRRLIGASTTGGPGLDELKILGSLQAPVAVFHGEHDRFVGYEYLSRLSIPGLWRKKIHILPGAGHFLHRDVPAVLARLLEEFAYEVFG